MIRFALWNYYSSHNMECVKKKKGARLGIRETSRLEKRPLCLFFSIIVDIILH